MPWNLDDPASKQKLDDIIRDRVQEASAAHDPYVTEWNEIEARLNTNWIPSGFTKEHQTAFAELQDPTTTQVSTKEYVAVNRARVNLESLLGELTAERRKLGVTARTPRDRARAKVIKKRLEHIEDVHQASTGIYFPCIDGMIGRGLHWSKYWYKSRIADALLRFKMDELSCRDVLVDPESRGSHFKTAKYLIHRQKYDIDDAAKDFADYPLFTGLQEDKEYERGYQNESTTVTGKRRYGTVYEVQFFEITRQALFLNPETKQLEEPDEARLEELQSKEETARYVFYGPEKEVYYIAFYNDKTGVFYLAENPVGMFTLVPWINIHTEGRLYPIGDIKIYANMLDLVDVLVTVQLEHGKRQNLPWMKFNPDVYREFQAQTDRAIQEGGALPGLEGIYFPQPMNVALADLITRFMGWIQDAAGRHGPSVGEIPRERIAKETVLAVMAKERRMHGRKDIMIDWALTRSGRILVKMCSVYDKDEDFIPLTDAPPGQPDYIPINVVWTESEYLSMLADMSQLPMPLEGNEQEMVAVEQKLMQIRRKFEMENDVREEMVEDGYRVGNQVFTPQELSNYLDENGAEKEAFFQQYQPEQGSFKRYHINKMDADADLNVVYRIDTDFRNDPQYQLQRAETLRRDGSFSRRRFAEELGIADAQEAIEEADQENQAIQLAKQIAANPRAMQAVMAILQRLGGANAGAERK